MGVLNEGIGRLCDEITAMRQGRKALRRELESGTAERKTAVYEMRKQFSTLRAAMAGRAKQDRFAFLTALRRSVGELRRQVRADLAGARRAWNGIEKRRHGKAA